MPREKSTPVRRSGHKFEAVIDNSDKALFQQSATQENGIIYEDENNEQIEDEYEEEEEEEANLVSSKKLNGNSFTKDMLLSKKAEYTSSSSSSAAVDDRNNFLLISSHKYSTLNQTYTNSADVEVHAIYNCLMFRHVEASSFADICSVSCPGNVLRSLKSFIASGLLRLCAKIINNQIALHIHMSIMKIQIYPSIPSFLVRWIWATDESSNTPEWVEIRPTPFRVHRFLAKASQCANNKMLAFSTIDQGLLERTLQDRGLLTTMRRYQLQGVMWMLQRLGYSFPSNETKAVISRDGSEDGNLCGWIPLISSNVSTSMVSSGSSSSAAVGDCGIWYNLITEELKIGRPRDDITQHPSPRSLLLSDVMGMGKTLQIISLVLAIKLSHRHETSIPLCKPSLVHSSENNQLNEDDIADEYDEAGACLCERPTLISTDVDWVQCPTCRGWSHAACYGFNSSEAAESAQAFICLACECRAASRPGCKLQSHATVVLMPNPLLAQWVSEIRKHISSQRLVVEYEFAESTQTKEPSTSSTVDNAESDLSSSDSKSKHSIETNSPFRVFVYESSAVNDLKRRGLTFANIRPSALASYDLILLDLRTLQRDFHLVKATSGYEGGARTSSRPRNAHENKRTKSAYFPPPFMCIQFELVVVDETQKLESEGENQALYLARSLDARCQVSVSGTPLGTERASDLRPLCQFLRLVPFDTDDRSSSLMWNRIFGERSICVNESIRMKWLESLFSGVILRRTKEMVREQLELKDQLEITKPLLFSEFEMALYKEKAGPMLTEINALIIQNAGATADDGIDGRTIEPGSGRKRRLRNNRVEDALIDAQGKLEVLRKGCCHPQILDPSLTGRRLRGDFQDRRPRPFKDIIILKVEQARLIVAEKQRSLLAHVCKFAGIQLLFAQLSMQRSDDNSMVDSDSNSKRHLKQALRAYLWCWELIHGSNRNILPLLATATSSSNVCVELSLISDPTSICTGFQCMELASSKDERVDNSGSVDMLWSLRGSTAKTLTNAPLPLLLSVPHSHALLDPGLHYDLHFTNKKRLISGNLYVSLDVKYILAQVRQRSAMLGLSMELLDTVKSSFRNFSALSPIEITSSSTTQYIAPANCETVELLRILLPEIVVVQQIVGTQDTAVNIAECRFEFDIRNLLSDITDEIECALDVKEGQRSRNWRVLVKSLHSNCMVLKGYRDRDSHFLSHYWISWENIGKLPIEASSRSDHYLGSFVAMRGEFLEADIEVDAFQELHVCHNFGYAMTQYRNLFCDEDAQVTGLDLEKMATALARSRVRVLNEPTQSLSSHTTISNDIGIERQELNVSDNAVVKITDNSSMLKLIEDRAVIIKSEYLEAAAARQATARWKVNEASEKVDIAEQELVNQLAGYQEGRIRREWWNDLLPYYDHDSSFSCALRTHVELGGDAYSRFRMFRDASGLAYIVSAEFKTLVDAREKAVKGIRSMSTAPDTLEILDGSDCQRCRNYFGKTGPVCRHCKLKDVVKAYEKCMYGFRRSLKMTVNNTSNSTKGMKGRKSLKKNSKISTINESNRLVNNSIDELDSSDEIDIRELDREQIDGPFLMIAKQMRSLASRVGRRDLIEVAATELRWLAAIEVELRCMNLSWNRHLELLKSHDEIVMCVSRLQLATGSENSVEFIREYELEDSATEAMNSAIVSECDLRSSLSTFNFYREQEAKIRISMTEYGTSIGTKMALTVSPMSNNLTNKSATRMTDDAALHKMQKDMNDDCCIICREPLFPSESRDDSDGTLVAVLLPCAHVFHKACISQWLAKREACVICKAKTKLTDLVVIEKPQAIMRDTRQVILSPHTKVGVDAINADGLNSSTFFDESTRLLHELDPCLYSLSTNALSEPMPRLNGQWGTKVDALLRDILSFLSSPSCVQEKAIVFSQWTEMLEIVSEALQFNNVRHCVCVNRSKDFGPRGALAHFKAEPDLRVLLMPLHLGAEGLDLIVASRVFLLEPLVNRALETQAINRIHRIGQTRQAVVHKYVILGTVEQGIHERYRDLEDDNEMDNDQEQEQDIKNLGSHISLGESQQSHTPPRAQVKRFETPVSNKTVHSQESPNRKSAVVKAKGDAKAVSFHDIKSLLGGH